MTKEELLAAIEITRRACERAEEECDVAEEEYREAELLCQKWYDVLDDLILKLEDNK